MMYRKDVAGEACPSGWKLPTVPEWNTLASSIGTKLGLNFQLGGLFMGGDFMSLGKDAGYWAKDAMSDFWKPARTLSGRTTKTDPYNRAYIRCIKK